MKIKVCGMKDPDNIKELYQLPIDMMGMIFYEKSPRFVNRAYKIKIKEFNPSIQLTGVFVNETIVNILRKVSEYNLDIVQLHGNESPNECKLLKENRIKVIKAFSIEKPEDFNPCLLYENDCDYFLFDTKTSQYGGSGKKFDWQILSHYRGCTPFFLSGGINAEDSYSLKEIKHSRFTGIDLNSKFELSPGVKDINKLKNFISNFKNE